MSTQTLKVKAVLFIVYYAKYKQFSIGDTSFDYTLPQSPLDGQNFTFIYRGFGGM